MDSHVIGSRLLSSVLVLLGVTAPGASWADGILLPPILPGGLSPTIWESMQEAIIIHDLQPLESRAVENLIVKLSVQSLEDVETFNWVIPFPNPPETALENPKIFEEIRSHVTDHGQEDGRRTLQEPAKENRKGPTREADTREGPPRERETKEGAEIQEAGVPQASAPQRAQEAPPGEPHAAPQDASRVQVISRKTVGRYDVAVVRALQKGALDDWLEKEGFRSTQSEGKDVVESYREKGYVFACVKVNDVKLAKGRTVELHPLRFTFETGGRDGVYFPMKMTSLQKAPFDLELHIFSPTPIDENASPYGYAHRGLRRRYRDGNENGDAPEDGRSWSALDSDRVLGKEASHLPSLSELFRRLRPDGKHYLTSIGAQAMRPEALESWRDDLWVFPRYPEADFVPFDARPGGPAAAGWAKAGLPKGKKASRSEENAREHDPSDAYPLSGLPTRHVDVDAKEHE